MNTSSLTRTLTAAIAIAALPAFAQQLPPPPVPSPPPTPPTLPLDASEKAFWDQESRLVKQLRLMELHAAIAEAQRKVDGENTSNTGGSWGRDAVNLPTLAPPLIRPGSTPPDSAQMLDFLPPPPPHPLRRSTGLVDVVSIWGLDGEHTADVLSNGMRVSVREGDALPDGWKVESIRRTGIVIAKGRQRETLVVASALGD